jgi:hypothetical protein
LFRNSTEAIEHKKDNSKHKDKDAAFLEKQAF